MNILVLYYSATGNIASLAESIAEGAKSEGAQTRLRRVSETAPPEAIASNPKWADYVERTKDEPVATLDDLEWADGLAVGSPTRFGGPASQLKSFLDTTGGLWFQNKLVDVVCTSFTSASTDHGGLESTILAINNHFYHWGSIVVPLGYGDAHVARVSGNPYGASFVSRKGAGPDDTAIEAARLQGARLARVTRWVVDGRSS